MKNCKVLISVFLLALMLVFPVFSHGVGNGTGDSDPLVSTLKKDYYIAKMRKAGHDYSAKLRYVDSLEMSGSLAPCELFREKTDIYISSGCYRRAIEMLSDIVEMRPGADTTLFALYNLAYCRQATGNYEKALDDIYSLTVMDKPDTLMSYQLYSDFLLARIYRMAGRYGKSDTILDVALRHIPMHAKDSAVRYDLEYKWHLEKASALLDEERYNEALAALKKASSFDMDRESASLVSMGMAELYHHIGEDAIAEDYYRTFIKESPSPINRLYALNNYCSFLVAQHRYNEAIEICREQIEYAERNGVNHVRASLYGTLAEALYAVKDYKGAYEAHRHFYNIMDSVMHTAAPDITVDFENRMAREGGQNVKPASRGSVNVPYWLIVLLIALSAVLACIVILVSLRRIRIRRQTAGKPISLAVDTELPAKCEPEFADGGRDREYLSLTLRLAEINQVIKEVFDIALDRSKGYDERKSELNAIWSAHCANRNFWEQFRISFEKTHPVFFRSLYERHPALSRGEVRMCSFIIMNLSTKDIAMLTNRSVRTVESMKYRLGKKLNLPEGQTTEAYLRSLM